MAQGPASTELAQVAAMEVAVDAGDSVPCPLMSQFEALVAVQLTCEMGSTSVEVRDSCWGTGPRCRNTQNQEARWYMFEVTTRAVRGVVAESGKESLARWKSRTNWSCRSRWTTQGIQVNQPGATVYRRRSMPVAAVAEIVKATCRSHTASAGRRDDCNTVRQRVPGSALLISTEAPAFRFKGIKSKLDNKRAGSTRIS